MQYNSCSSMLNSLKVQKFIYSRWVLGICLVVCTHYLTVIYYTRTLSNGRAVGGYESPEPVNMDIAEPKMVVFPVNVDYYPAKGAQAKRHEILEPEPKEKIDLEKNEPTVVPKKEPTVSPKKESTVAPKKDPAPKIEIKKEPEKPQSAATIKPVQSQPKPVKPKSETSGSEKIISNPPALNQVKDVQKPAAQPPAKQDDRKRLILAWTQLTAKKPLWGIKYYTFMHCPYSNCVMTDNRTRLNEADMLIFRIRELKKNMSAAPLRPYVHPIDPSDIPPYHKADQIWMDINQESPVYTHADEEVGFLNGAFNLSSNYLLNSDYSISYIPQVKLRASGDKPAPVNYAAGKTKMALWFVSHCGASSGRDEYVKELQKHNITVDIFGKCTGKSDGCKPGNHTCYKEVRSKYKFYLALENSICNEYITEKFWNTLQSDSYNIPIALGASVKQYEQFSPPNSFLHTRNFTTVKALADFMIKLDKDDVAYNTYHQWRQTHTIVPRERKETLHCYMCRQANEKKDGGQEYKNISKYWSRKNHCDILPEPIK